MPRNRFKPVHGHAIGKSSPTYRAWLNMRARCNRPTASNYRFYGGRGIRVCERWNEYSNFLADMGERPEAMTLDRYPNQNGNYEPRNCRWATKEQQNQNRRGISTLHVEYQGRTQSLKAWCRELKIKYATAYYRLVRRGYSIEATLHVDHFRAGRKFSTALRELRKV